MEDRTSLLDHKSNDRHSLFVHSTINPKLKPKNKSTRKSWRRQIYHILHFQSSKRSKERVMAEVFIVMLVLTNVILTLIISTPSFVKYARSRAYFMFLCFSATVFLIEYALRIWTSIENKKLRHWFFGRLRWMLKPMSIVDLLSLLPYLFEIYIILQTKTNTLTFRGASMLRIFRVFIALSFLRIERLYDAANKIKMILRRKKEELLIVGYMTALSVLVGSATIFCLENPVQPTKFTNLAVCGMWTVVTMTSLGYGNLIPITAGGKFLTSFLALLGVALFSIPGALIGSAFVEIMLEERQKAQTQFHRHILRKLNSENIAQSHRTDITTSSSSSSVSSFCRSVHLQGDDTTARVYSLLQSLQKRQEVMEENLILQKKELQFISSLLCYRRQ